MNNQKNIIIGLGVISLILFVSAFALYIKNNTNNKKLNPTEIEYTIDKNDFIKDDELVKNITPSDLSDDERIGIILMREEEKLARDVYITLGKKWELNIFTNISNSEQTHTDAVKVLLDRYTVADPVKTNTVGIFTDNTMQKLYDDLVKQGSQSLTEALIVGATIEDLDIKDLQKLLDKTDNQDIITTYNNLEKGSRNHMRAFIRQLKQHDVTYTPQFISQELFDSIISSEQEKGKVGGERKGGRYRK